MNCFPCFRSNKESDNNDDNNNSNNNNDNNNNLPVAKPKDLNPSPPPVNNDDERDPLFGSEDESNRTRNFTFRELAMATKNFRQECLLGEGGFGRIFKGTLQGSGQIVAVRQLDRNGVQASKEFVMEVAKLNMLEHRNLVKLFGYCADGDQRLLVYEYMPLGSLKTHLFELPAGKKPLDWTARMKVALGVAEGLEYLHEKTDPPMIYRDLKPSNILLDDGNNPKLSEYGLVNLMPTGNKLHISPRVIASNGYCAPEYESHGELTSKSDVYSFGVVLLELITGRKALDTSRPAEEQNLVSWAQPFFRDPSKFPDLADPLLRKGFSVTSLNQAVGVAAMCLMDEPSARPLISDVSAALTFLATAPPEAPIPERLVSMLSSRVQSANFGELESFREGSVAVRNTENTSDSSEDEGQEMDKHGSRSSSEYEYGDSSDHSDSEGETRVPSQKKDSAYKLNESKKLASSSKRKSKKLGSSSTRKSKKLGSSSKHKNTKESQGNHHISVSKRSCSSRSSSGSRDSSAGFNLKSKTSIPDRKNCSNSVPKTTQQSHHSSSSSSDDDETLEISFGSDSPHMSDANNASINYTSDSNKDLHAESMNSEAPDEDADSMHDEDT